MKNENLMTIVVVALIAVVALQAFQIFAMNQPRYETPAAGMSSGNMMASGGVGQEQFNSVEDMMEAHHGSGSGGTVGSCGGH